MSFSETVFLFFLALIIFGPKKLPEIARQVGKYLNEFKRASNEFKAQIEQEIAHLEMEDNKPTILPPKPSLEGTTSRTAYASSTVSYAEPPSSPEAAVAETSSTQAAAGEQPPAPDNGSAPPVATEGVHPSEEVTSNASQESHA
ncbi:MAG TPA: twin-arginine translocase TatA/TatE family subunit [Dongiaceae bacterium]|nr:twin-arginine translocase TatA/TatE family subunit [Dongiaceae bacterium]